MRIAILACLLVSCMGAAPGPRAQERYEYSQLVMGTQARIVLYAGDEVSAREAAAAAFARMIALDNMLTDWRADSELMRLCAGAGNGAQVVSDDLYTILEKSVGFSRESDGAFDVTLGPLTRLWRETRERGELPKRERLEAAKARTGWKRIEFLNDPKAGAKFVRLMPETLLDLGGIAKGYACDQALEVLSGHGIESALVEIGGDLVVSAAPPGREAWRVAAGCGSAETNEVIALEDAAIATSGDTEQFVIIDGERYSHILDPRTGLGLRHSLCISVIARDATTADALASAVSVLGIRRGQTLAAKYGVVPLLPGCESVPKLSR